MIYVPQEISEFTYSNITPIASDYNAATSYAVGDLARIDAIIYKSTLENNIGNNPENTLGIYWIEWDVSNEYAMLDLYPNTYTEWDADGIVEFPRAAIDVIVIGNFIALTATIENLDDSNNVLYTEAYNNSINRNVWNEWDYGYGGFSYDERPVAFFYVRRTGTKIRVTFARNGEPTKCGFIVGGKQQDMGCTIDKVSFPDKKIGTTALSVANFQTALPKKDLVRKMNLAKTKIDETMAFIIDEKESSVHQNMVILGKITKCSGIGANQQTNFLTWEVTQTFKEY
mgnify:CR=1 FL=1